MTLFQNKKDILANKTIAREGWESDWRDFLKKDTYLIQNEKNSFLERMKNLKKYPWHFWFDLRLCLNKRKDKRYFSELKRVILDYNEKFIEKRLEVYETFFSGKDDSLTYPLNLEQRIAIIRDDKHNLVVAGAGAGKTSVLTSRIAYLDRRKDRVDLDRVLALAFNKDAVKEMEQRLLRNYGIKAKISTFHSLGYEIIRNHEIKRPNLLFDGIESKQNDLISSLFKSTLVDKNYQNLFVKYLAYHSEQEVQEDSFEDKEEFYRYMKNLKYTTLNNKKVGSISERDIGNFLFLNGVEYEYERKVHWVDKDDKDKNYQPDFYLPEYDVYIEHWGVNRNYKIPHWFSISSEEYMEKRRWKLEQFEKHGKTLIETWDYERLEGTLIKNLTSSLLYAVPKFKLSPLSYEEIVEKTNDFKQYKKEYSHLIGSFIKTAKANFYSPKKIKKKIESHKYSNKQQLFGMLAVEIFEKYQEYLKEKGEIDYNDMINRAVKIVRKNPEKYINKYDHVLVDEFQDISHQRKELIKGFVNETSKTKLFCVGDDWQSIYQFTGSDIDLFVNFERDFPYPEVSLLQTNYRSTLDIVKASSELISHNKHQISKNMRSFKSFGPKIIIFDLSRKFLYRYRDRLRIVKDFIQALLEKGVKPNDVMVLSRFKFNLRELEVMIGAEGIPTEKKTKGVRFCTAHGAKGLEAEHVIVLDAISGLYGFPCEIQDSSVLNLAKRYDSRGFIEEERRLFYVALTRSKKYLNIFTIYDNNSIFLSEIREHARRIFVKHEYPWKRAEKPSESQKTIDDFTSTPEPEIEEEEDAIVFVLKLKDAKWYVGKTNDLNHRLKVIMNGNGPAWTRLYGPESLERIIEGGDLKEVTLECMKEYGWKNVRGYAWSQRNLKAPPKELRTFFSEHPKTSESDPLFDMYETLTNQFPLRLEAILNVLTFEWRDINDLIMKLDLKDDYDRRFLDIQLTKLYRKGAIESRSKNNIVYWKKI